MHGLETSLRERVHDLLVTHRDREIMSTTGLQATVDELLLRVRGLEEALIEIASEVEALRAANPRPSARVT